jgi:hypothetical protein
VGGFCQENCPSSVTRGLTRTVPDSRALLTVSMLPLLLDVVYKKRVYLWSTRPGAELGTRA